jgi:ribosomal protein S1
MSWSRVADPSTIVKPGDEITVRVLRVEDDKIALGLKQRQADPWATAGDTYEPGQVLRGRVERLADFGAFIALEPGILGLAHVSTFAAGGARQAWRESVPVGSEVAVEILEVDLPRKRIALAVAGAGSPRAQRMAEASEAREAEPQGRESDPDERLGSLADKLRDALGGRLPKGRSGDSDA